MIDQQYFNARGKWNLKFFTAQKFKACIFYFFFPSGWQQNSKIQVKCVPLKVFLHKVIFFCLQASPPKSSVKQTEVTLMIFNKWPNRHMCSLVYKNLSRCYFPGIQWQTITHSGKGTAQVNHLNKVHEIFHPVAE